MKKEAINSVITFILSFLFVFAAFAFCVVGFTVFGRRLGGNGRSLLLGLQVGLRSCPVAFQHDAAQRQFQVAQGLYTPLGRQLAFPHDDYVPSGSLQQRLVALVALTVTGNLVLPELRIGRWAVTLALMSVPEAAVDKNRRPPLAHHNVGSARQRLDIQPVTETLMPQPTPHHQLRLGVAPPDAAHATMPLLQCHLVCHALQSYHFIIIPQKITLPLMRGGEFIVTLHSDLDFRT